MGSSVQTQKGSRPKGAISRPLELCTFVEMDNHQRPWYARYSRRNMVHKGIMAWKAQELQHLRFLGRSVNRTVLGNLRYHPQILWRYARHSAKQNDIVHGCIKVGIVDSPLWAWHSSGKFTVSLCYKVTNSIGSYLQQQVLYFCS